MSVSGFTTTAPGRLEKRTGGGCLAIVGLPFLFMGLASIAMAVGLLQTTPPATPVVALLGLPFLAAGIVMVFFRAGLVLDREAGTLTQWWGLAKPMKCIVHRLDAARNITLRREVRGTGKNRQTVHPVRLEIDGDTPVELDAPSDYFAARLAAERVARFLALPLEDDTSGAVVRRDPRDLDECLRDRARRTGEEWALPATPAGSKVRVKQQGDHAEIVLPAAGLGGLELLQLIVGTGATLGVLFGVLKGSSSRGFVLEESNAVLGVCAFVVLPLVLSAASTLARARAVTILEADASGLRLRQQGLLWTKLQRIPGKELEEVVLPSPPPPATDAPPILASLLAARRERPGLVARSDHATLTFGQGLGEAELAYVHAVVMRALTR